MWRAPVEAGDGREVQAVLGHEALDQACHFVAEIGKWGIEWGSGM